MKALLLEVKPVRWVLCKAVGKVVPSIFWSWLSCLRYGEIPEPSLPGPGWVKLRTILGGICGTDLAMITQRTHPATIIRPFTSFPIILGHENVAVIDEVGADVTGWSPGTRVVVEPALSCQPRGIEPPCAPCAAGHFALCEKFLGEGEMPAGTMLGLNNFTGGSWAPRFVAHQSQLHAVPEEISDEEAVVIDPLACSLHAVLRHPPAATDHVVVQGAGIVGLGVVGALRALGHDNEITCLARHKYQADWVRRLGADRVILIPRGLSRAEQFERMAAALGATRVSSMFGNQTLVGGAEVVFDCVGSGRSLSDAMKFCKSRGTVVAAGTSQITLVDTTPLWFGELTIVGAYGRQLEVRGRDRIHTYELIFDLVRSKKLALKGLLTHTFDAADYQRAFATLAAGGRTRIIKAAFRHHRKR